MSNRAGFRDVWATTDKSIIDIMKKKTSSPHPATVDDGSSEDSSDSESVDTSYGPFAAIPKEFRPSLPAPPNPDYLNQAVLKPDRDSIWKEVGRGTFSTTPCTENRGSSESKQFSFRNSSCKNETPVTEKNVAGIDVSGKQTSISCRNQISFSVKNPAPAQPNRNFQEHPKAPNNRQQIPKAPVKERGTVFNGRPSSEMHKKGHNNIAPSSHQNTASRSKESKFQSKVNALKYEVTRKRQSETVQVAFRMPSNSFSKGRLEYDAKFVGEQKGALAKSQKSCPEAKFERQEAIRECLVKWDSSLNLGNQSSEDAENEIRWTFIQGQKTAVTATKTTDKKHVREKSNNECPSDEHRRSIEAMKPPRKHFRQKRSHDKPNESNCGKYKTGTRKAPRPDKRERDDYVSRVPTYKNSILLNNNLACVQKENRNSKTGEKCCNVDDKNFASQSGMGRKDSAYLDAYRIARDDFSTLETNCKLIENIDKEWTPPNRNIYRALPDDSSALETPYSLTKIVDSRLKLTAENFEDFNRNTQSSTRVAKMDNAKKNDDRKNCVLVCGREMSDLVIGSHKTLNLLFFYHREWKLSRVKLIDHFEQLEKMLIESTKKFARFKEIINVANKGVSIATAIPVPQVSIAAKVVSIIASLFSSVFPERKRAEVEHANDLISAVLKDKKATDELYICGIQCHTQFEDTVKQIEQFHANAECAELFENESPEIADFLRGVLEYKPKERTFYKKLQKCFRELLQMALSDFGSRFCEPFILYESAAVDVIEFLDWRFNYIDFNPESVRHELEQIQDLIQGENPLIEDLLKRVQSCIRMLRDELEFLENCVKRVSPFGNSLEKNS